VALTSLKSKPSVAGLLAFLARWGVALAALALALAITGRTHFYFMRPYAVPLSNDEGYITAMALRMVRGHWLPYVDAVSQRGPITYWLCTLVMSLGGLFSWMVLRWLSMALAFCIVTISFLLAAELFSPFAAAVAVLVQTYFVTYELTPWDGLGYNGELVAMPFVLLSSLLVARMQTGAASSTVGARGHRRWARAFWLATAGGLAACALLSKQVTFLHVLPAALWLLVGPSATDDSGSERPRWLAAQGLDVGCYALGFVVPFALVVGIYAAAGHLRDFVYYYQRYGRDIFMAPLTREVMASKLREELDKYLLGLACVVSLVVLALARAVRDVFGAPRGWGRWRRQAPALFALLHFFAAAAGATFTWRFFGHYFVQMYPFLGLVAGYALSERFEDMDEDHLPTVFGGLLVVAGALVLLALADSALHRFVRLQRSTDRWYKDPESDEIVRYVREKTLPSGSIFVWGFRAETYVSARRYPASRFVYTVYPSGIVPWFETTLKEEASRVVPGSQELLLDDLEHSKPELVVDAGRSLHGRYMYEIPIFRKYLDEHYCFARYVDGEPIYRRRHVDACPRPDY
jgi:hypothetical protein